MKNTPMKQLQARLASVLVAVLLAAPMLLIGVNAWLIAAQS